MSANELEKIKEQFAELGLHPTYLEHEPVITSEQAAKMRGFELRQGIKAIIVTNKLGQYAVVNIPGDQKVDTKKVALALDWPKKGIEMATPDMVLEITGCEIGSVPPFGHKTTIPILVDKSVFDNTQSAFNIGLRTHSVKIPTIEMKTVFGDYGAILGNFIKVPLDTA